MKNQNPSQTIVNETHLAMRVSVISVIVNLVLSAFKLLAGIFANSGAMISDAVHLKLNYKIAPRRAGDIIAICRRHHLGQKSR